MNKMSKKVFIKTWGCQMNEYDSELLKNILKKNNKYIIHDKPETSDILILNTCSVREKAQEKVFHQLGRWKKIKKKNPELIIAVGGCVASQEGKKIYKRANYVNIVFSPQTLQKLPELLEKISKKNKFLIDISLKSLKKFNFSIKEKRNYKFSSNISIMEGCNKFCSFCIVPYTRGKEVSRSIYSIISEILLLSKKGIREITLLGQNVNSYSFYEKKNKKWNFSELIYEISKINGIDRIRYITSHPIDFNEDLINSYKNIYKLANMIHLPVQSGSDRILRLMKRGYTTQEYQEIIKKIKKIRPNMSISSDFIIGFPGETDEDFQKTLSFIKKINFDLSYSFLYSSRPGTRASKLKDFTTIENKKKRLSEIQKTISIQALQWKRRMLGTIQNVLIEKQSDFNPKEIIGKTDNNRTICCKGNTQYIGEFVKVRITDINYNKSILRGEII